MNRERTLAILLLVVVFWPPGLICLAAALGGAALAVSVFLELDFDWLERRVRSRFFEWRKGQ